MPENLPEEIKALQGILSQAEKLDIAVYRELQKSQALLEHGFYTESALRLGRAVEASIYSTATLLGISVSVAGLSQLDHIGDEIKVAQVIIAQGHLDNGIKRLLNCIKGLADAVDILVVPKQNTTQKQSRERPLPNRQLYKAFNEQIGKLEIKDKNTIRAKLGRESSQVDELGEIRNKAAHASLDGEEREVNREEYMDLVGKVSTVISTLFEIKVILQSS
jgi:hypothetical protein